MKWPKFRYNLGRSSEPEPMPREPLTEYQREKNKEWFDKTFGRSLEMSEPKSEIARLKIQLEAKDAELEKLKGELGSDLVNWDSYHDLRINRDEILTHANALAEALEEYYHADEALAAWKEFKK